MVRQAGQYATAKRRQTVTPWSWSSSSSLLQMNNNNNKAQRENEIRQKIGNLKRMGKIGKTAQDGGGDGQQQLPVSEQYGDRIQQKMGTRKARLLNNKELAEDPLIAELDSYDDDEEDVDTGRVAQLGSLPATEGEEDEDENKSLYEKPADSKSKSTTEYTNFDASQFEEDDNDDDNDNGDDDDDDFDMSEVDLVELVAKRLAEKQLAKRETEEAEAKVNLSQRLDELKKEQLNLKEEEQTIVEDASAATGKSTSGIGGRWIKNNETADSDYKPSSSGTWGVFDRPKDISRTFGGGKRVGAGYTPDVLNKKASKEDTRDRLQEYREKVGIDVQSEKDHAAEIEQALEIGKLAMQRGIYATAVSALEKVTKWCSTNSAVGGQVFLELAMAYEAIGRTPEAIAVYSTLTQSRMEDVKYNAKRLLYGIEAMQFMQNEAKKEFSRKRAKNTFIETTGLDNFAENFDDVYNTAYVDLDKGFYSRLTQSVVRTNREARQILIKAAGAGEVDRLKVVQALRSISRHFDDALEEEILSNQPAPEPTALMNGKPIIVEQERKEDTLQNRIGGMDEFVLVGADQMRENLDGGWRLQLLADKRGDGVKYYNTTFSWQSFDTNAMTFTSSGAAGFLTVDQTGGVDFQDERRILTRNDLSVSGTGGMLSGFLSKGSGGAAGAVSKPYQIVSVDSILLITRMAPSGKKKRYDDSTKEYFAVWRRAEPGSLPSSAKS